MVNVRVRHEREEMRDSVWFTHLASIDQADALIEHVQEAGGIYHARSGKSITDIGKRLVQDGRRCYVELILRGPKRGSRRTDRTSAKPTRRGR